MPILRKKLDFQYTEFDGCMYGLMSRYRGVVTLPIRHPWKIAYINCDIGKYLYKTCDRSHRHAPCSGLDALHLQGYTRHICERIRHCFKDTAHKTAIYVSISAAFEDLNACEKATPSLAPALASVEMAQRGTSSVWDTLPPHGVPKSYVEWPPLHGTSGGRPAGSSGDPLPAEASMRIPPYKALPKETLPPAKRASTPAKEMPSRDSGVWSRTPPPLKPAPVKPAEAGVGGGAGYPQQRRPVTPRRDARIPVTPRGSVGRDVHMGGTDGHPRSRQRLLGGGHHRDLLRLALLLTLPRRLAGEKG